MSRYILRIFDTLAILLRSFRAEPFVSINPIVSTIGAIGSTESKSIKNHPLK